MVTVEAPPSEDNIFSTSAIQDLIAKHAKDTALILLPGIQYYTGQLLDIPTITDFAHKHGIFIIWDLAHAVGNVPLHLKEWNVDAAAWCTYKYLNGGPGCIGGMFINSRNSLVTTQITDPNPERGYGKRLSGPLLRCTSTGASPIKKQSPATSHTWGWGSVVASQLAASYFVLCEAAEASESWR